MKVREAFGLNETKGDIGFEIEVEGNGVEQFSGMAGWTVTRDGSLRGEAVEIVLRKPANRGDLERHLNTVQDRAKELHIQVLDTGRAGVHVHLNMQEYNIAKMMNVVCAFMIFEDQLIEYCGEHRVGNLFCLRTRDAEGLVDSIREAVSRRDLTDLRSDHIRYAAMNLTSLSKYGSLEFRSMRSTIDPTILLEWTDLLLRVRDWAVEFANPLDLMAKFSTEGAPAVYDEVFGHRSPVVMNEDAMYEGVRQAQLIAFTTEDWDIDYLKEFRELVDKDGADRVAPIDELKRMCQFKKRFYSNVRDNISYLSALRREIANQEAMGEPRFRAEFPRGRINTTHEWALQTGTQATVAAEPDREAQDEERERVNHIPMGEIPRSFNRVKYTAGLTNNKVQSILMISESARRKYALYMEQRPRVTFESDRAYRKYLSFAGRQACSYQLMNHTMRHGLEIWENIPRTVRL